MRKRSDFAVCQAYFASIPEMLFEMFPALVRIFSLGVQNWNSNVFLLSDALLVDLLHSDQFCCSSIFCALLSLFVHRTPKTWAWPAYQRHGNMTPSCEAVAIAAFSSLSVLGSIGGWLLFTGVSAVWRQHCVQADKHPLVSQDLYLSLRCTFMQRLHYIAINWLVNGQKMNLQLLT